MPIDRDKTGRNDRVLCFFWVDFFIFSSCAASGYRVIGGSGSGTAFARSKGTRSLFQGSEVFGSGTLHAAWNGETPFIRRNASTASLAAWRAAPHISQ
jgi:hypothetical protein